MHTAVNHLLQAQPTAPEPVVPLLFWGVFFFLTILYSLQGSSFPDQGLNLWKLGVLTTGPPGNSPEVLFFFFNFIFLPLPDGSFRVSPAPEAPNILLGDTIPVQDGSSQPQKSWEATVLCPEIRNTMLWGQRHSLEVDLSAHLKAQTGCSDASSGKEGVHVPFS